MARQAVRVESGRRAPAAGTAGDTPQWAGEAQNRVGGAPGEQRDTGGQVELLLGRQAGVAAHTGGPGTVCAEWCLGEKADPGVITDWRGLLCSLRGAAGARSARPVCRPSDPASSGAPPQSLTAPFASVG